MRLVKIGPTYIDMDGGVSATTDGDDSIELWDTRSGNSITIIEEDGEIDGRDNQTYSHLDVIDLRKWLDKNSDDIHTRGGVGPVTMQDTRR